MRICLQRVRTTSRPKMWLTSGECSGRRGRERGRRERTSSEREEERESGLLKEAKKNTKKRGENSLLERLGLIKTTSFCLFKTTSFWLSENLSPACADDRSSETFQTTCCFRLIQTTGRLIHTNDTSFASATERQCIQAKRHAVCSKR